MSKRISINDVQIELDRVNSVTGRSYYAFYESGSARIAIPVGKGRSTVYMGTARECYTYAIGMRETATLPKAV